MILAIQVNHIHLYYIIRVQQKEIKRLNMNKLNLKHNVWLSVQTRDEFIINNAEKSIRYTWHKQVNSAKQLTMNYFARLDNMFYKRRTTMRLKQHQKFIVH